MYSATRREFLKTSVAFACGSILLNHFAMKNRAPLLAFSTLGCPDWTFVEILDFAVKHGYHGIEVRGILRELDLPKCNEFKNAESRATTLKMVEDKGLRFVDLGSSSTLHFNEPAERKKNLDEGKRFIDLAQDIHCPFIRVYPNIFPKDRDKNETMDLITKGLLELGDYAKGSRVKVLIESHGDLVWADDLEKVMRAAEHDHVGMVWDITNMWTITKEDPKEVYKKLKKYIHHAHIKDAKVIDGKTKLTLFGQGEVPIFDAIDVLSKDDYKGYYSFEWEKLWHPELEEPEIALAEYPILMKRHFKIS